VSGTQLSALLTVFSFWPTFLCLLFRAISSYSCSFFVCMFSLRCSCKLYWFNLLLARYIMSVNCKAEMLSVRWDGNNISFDFFWFTIIYLEKVEICIKGLMLVLLALPFGIEATESKLKCSFYIIYLFDWKSRWFLFFNKAKMFFGCLLSIWKKDSYLTDTISSSHRKPTYLSLSSGDSLEEKAIS
jgi:hypothetical protein